MTTMAHQPDLLEAAERIAEMLVALPA